MDGKQAERVKQVGVVACGARGRVLREALETRYGLRAVPARRIFGHVAQQRVMWRDGIVTVGHDHRDIERRYALEHCLAETIDPALVADVASVFHILATSEWAQVAPRTVGRLAGRLVYARDAIHTTGLASVGATRAASLAREAIRRGCSVISASGWGRAGIPRKLRTTCAIATGADATRGGQVSFGDDGRRRNS